MNAIAKSFSAILLFRFLMSPWPAQAQSAANAPSDKWEFAATPHLLDIGMSGDIEISRRQLDFQAGTDDLSKPLDFAFMGNFAARRNLWSFPVDALRADMGQDVTVEQATGDPAVQNPTTDDDREALSGGGQIQEEEPWWVAEGRACEGCPRRSVGKALLETTLIVNGIAELGNLARGQVTARINPKTWWTNMKQGWVWDLDDFAVNQIGHPYQGNLYFNSARVRRSARPGASACRSSGRSTSVRSATCRFPRASSRT